VSAPHLFTSRRATLGGALVGLAAVAGCDDEPGPVPTPGSTTSAAPNGDADLVAQVITQIAAAVPVVVAARRLDPQLRAALRPFADLHQAHLAALEPPEDLELPGRPAAVGLRGVRAAESTLQRQLTEAAVGAESGALAGLLASMAAAVAQHLAVLP
jgi:hypothetical protein